jgi:hypothetical protein
MTSIKEKQAALIEQAMAAEASWDVDRIISLRTPDATHNLLPPSMGWPTLNNDDFKEKFGPLCPVFAGKFKVGPQDA